MKITTFFRLLLLSIPLISFGQTSNLSVNITATAAKCNGSSNGSAIANVSGGTGPYTYTWGPTGGNGDTATNLAAGTYTVTIKDANGLTVIDTITITQPPTLTVSIDSIIVLPCFRLGVHQNPHPLGGGACGCSNTLWPVVNGGTPPYTYYWTPNGETTDTLSGACYEEFAVYVTDKNGCVTSDSENVVVPGTRNTGPQVSVVSTDVRCHGDANGTAIANVVGGTPPYTFNWAPKKGADDTVINLAVGMYTITVTDFNGLTDEQIIYIGSPQPITASLDSIIVTPCSSTGTSCCNNTLWAMPNGGTAPYTYSWSPGGATTDTIANVCYDEYTVLITDQNGCNTTNRLNVVAPTTSPAGINRYTNSVGLNLYPVPAGNQLTISISDPSLNARNIEIYDLLGSKILEQKINPNDTQVTLDVSGLMTGNYLLKITGGNNGQKIARFTVAGK